MIRPTHSLVFLVFPGLLWLSGFAPRASHAGEPSPAYKASLRRTLELRKQRRRVRVAPPAGAIVPYPLPPSLIIRHRPEVHTEIEGLLGMLRRSSG